MAFGLRRAEGRLPAEDEPRRAVVVRRLQRARGGLRSRQPQDARGRGRRRLHHHRPEGVLERRPHGRLRLGRDADRSDVIEASRHHHVHRRHEELPASPISKHPTLAGWTHHAVHFDNVRVPALDDGRRTCIEGWKVVMGAIDFERAALASPGLVSYQLDRLLAWCAQDRDGAAGCSTIRWCTTSWSASRSRRKAARLMSYWLASLHARGLRPQHETSLALLAKRETAAPVRRGRHRAAGARSRRCGPGRLRRRSTARWRSSIATTSISSSPPAASTSPATSWPRAASACRAEWSRAWISRSTTTRDCCTTPRCPSRARR